MPEWLWILLGISFITTILFATVRGQRMNELEDKVKRLERRK